jgi:hypothetical protein
MAAAPAIVADAAVVALAIATAVVAAVAMVVIVAAVADAAMVAAVVAMVVAAVETDAVAALPLLLPKKLLLHLRLRRPRRTAIVLRPLSRPSACVDS